VAIGVSKDGYRKVLGAVEGTKEDKAGWSGFLRHLKERGLKGVKLVISDACLGLVESVGDFYPEAKWQRCIVHFYRNVFTVVPRGKVKDVAIMLKAIHASEDRQAASEKAEQVIKKLEAKKLRQAAAKVRDSIQETLTYYDFPSPHWRRIRTNNPLERILREVRRRTRVVGTFPDGNSALMLVAARLRHIAGTRWGTKRYLNTNLLSQMTEKQEIAA
jgi:transposase-like protein